MSSLDDIKKKLKIEDMDKNDRDKIFNKFVEKGGKVIEDKQKSKSVKFNRDQQIIVSQKMSQKNEELKQKYSSRDNKYESYSNSSANSGYHKKKRYFSEFLNGLLKGIFNIYGKFSRKFIESIEKEFYEIISSLNFLTGQILLLEGEQKWQMVTFINQKNAFNFELIIRVNNLQKDNRLTKIIAYFSKDNNIVCDLIIDDLVNIEKELIILYPYWESIKDSLWRAGEYYHQITQIQPYLSKSKIFKMIDTLFANYYPAIHTIINYNLGKKTPYDFRFMYKDYSIDPKDDIGSLTKNLMAERKKYLEQIEKEKEERLKSLQNDVVKKELDKMPKYLKKGLEIIDSVLLANKHKSTDQNLKIIDPKEKMYNFYESFSKSYGCIVK